MIPWIQKLRSQFLKPCILKPWGQFTLFFNHKRSQINNVVSGILYLQTRVTIQASPSYTLSLHGVFKGRISRHMILKDQATCHEVIKQNNSLVNLKSQGFLKSWHSNFLTEKESRGRQGNQVLFELFSFGKIIN